MFCLFDKNHTAKLNIFSDEISVRKACDDFLRDLIYISGNENFNRLAEIKKTAAHLTNCTNGGSGVLTITENPALSGPEAYEITITDSEITIAGSDSLGIIYGIYDFEKEYMGIDPLMQFSDFMPKKRESLFIPEGTLRKGAPAVPFRGWFINDEDLLSEFRGGEGRRNQGYKFYDSVIRSDVFDMILETALRCGYNFIIPSTFVNIFNPPEERLVRQSYERGLYISQHHIEPLGVSHFAAEAYMKRAGLSGAFSFLGNRENTIAVWKAFVEAWRPYADRVIWQLGLRGKTDVPVWVTDGNVPDTDEAHGALITDAIATEHRILEEAYGPDFYSTMTLWHEGANLYKQGFLTAPRGTTVVFADAGFDQMYSNDFYEIDRLPDVTYGVYQHCAFYSKGPHNAEGTEPRKLVYSTTEAYTHGSLFYTVMNVTNVRPMINSIALHSAVLRDPAAWVDPKYAAGAETAECAVNEGSCECAVDDTFTREKLDDYFDKFYRFYFGSLGTVVQAFRARYFTAMADLGVDEAKLCYHRHAFDFHDAENLPFRRFTASDGEIIYWGKSPYRKGGITLYPHPIYDWVRDEFRRSVQDFDALRKELTEFRPQIEKACPEALAYYDTNLCFQTDYMRLLTHWVLEIREIRESRFIEKRVLAGEKAVAYLEEILRVRDVMAQGKWEGWWTGDRKHDVASFIPMTKAYTYEGNILNLEKYK